MGRDRDRVGAREKGCEVSPLLFIAIAVAGGLGAGVRMLFDGAYKAWSPRATPWSTLLINVSGSLVLGFLTGLAGAQLLPETWHLVLGTGFLGGYTTFSTASFETISLIEERKWGSSLLSGLGTLVFATAAAGLGLWLGGLG
ncbi:camphor resistance protein CrcB [Brevibacterium iodinum ATCC 49514]|uniref:Fluoride-specific ion channel FluC n=1 Tax=Brevibacterium iodinum ATCC 49514 TaxID=1255616 RepID=A0A2H1J8J6_9MICO|nr:camphor resistance protein CrcB [Brevibacterium iodinum ATCC 49514]SUW11151.1 camphor resistance protein CrcB [Brevibacterium iodinum]